MAFLNSGLQKTKILVADKDSDYQKCVCPVLKYDGYSVESAYDGVTASKFWQDVDLVMISDNLADLSGEALIQSWKQKCPSVPVIYIMEKVHPQKTHNSPDGADIIMVKPVNGPLLLRKIAELLYAEDDADLEDELEDLKREYIVVMQEQIRSIKTGIENCIIHPEDDAAFSGAIVLMHRIRGTAGSYGFTDLGLQAGRLEDAAKSLDRTTKPIDWDPIKSELSELESLAALVTIDSEAA